jgi:hypothetical protein
MSIEKRDSESIRLFLLKIKVNSRKLLKMYFRMEQLTTNYKFQHGGIFLSVFWSFVSGFFVII